MPLLKSTTAKIGAITIGIAAMGGAVLYMPGLIRDDAAINDVESDRSVNVAEQTGPGERNIIWPGWTSPSKRVGSMIVSDQIRHLQWWLRSGLILI